MVQVTPWTQGLTTRWRGNIPALGGPKSEKEAHPAGGGHAQCHQATILASVAMPHLSTSRATLAEKEGAAEKAGRVGGGEDSQELGCPPKVSKVNDGEEQSLWGSRESAWRAYGQSPAHGSLGLSWCHPHVPQKLSQWHPQCPRWPP